MRMPFDVPIGSFRDRRESLERIVQQNRRVIAESKLLASEFRAEVCRGRDATALLRETLMRLEYDCLVAMHEADRTRPLIGRPT